MKNDFFYVKVQSDGFIFMIFVQFDDRWIRTGRIILDFCVS